jgi:hypothetical protein
MREEEQEGLVDRRVWSRTFKGSFDGFRPTAKEPRLSKNLIIFFLVRYPWTRNPLLDVLRAITSQSSSLNHLTGIVFLQKERTRGYNKWMLSKSQTRANRAKKAGCVPPNRS